MSEKRKNKVGKRGKGKGMQWEVGWLGLVAGLGRGTLMSTGMLAWISCGSHPHASNWWVPHIITQIANPSCFSFHG